MLRKLLFAALQSASFLLDMIIHRRACRLANYRRLLRLKGCWRCAQGGAERIAFVRASNGGLRLRYHVKDGDSGRCVDLPVLPDGGRIFVLLPVLGLAPLHTDGKRVWWLGSEYAREKIAAQARILQHK